MRLITVCILLAFATGSSALNVPWTSAVPTEIHLVPNGMVIVGEFDTRFSICATGEPSAVFLPRNDPMFKEKLTLALTAKASGHRLRLALLEPKDYSCVFVPEIGFIPVLSSYFWQLTSVGE